jgi:hypothetical protein
MRQLILAASMMALAAPLQLAAQTPQRDLAAQRAAMDRLDALQGRWLGQGERYLADGTQVAMTQTMIIEPHANGLVLTIEGKSLRHGPADVNQPGSGSYAVVTFDDKAGDDKAGAYEFRSFGFGEMVAANAELLNPALFRWTVAAGPAMLRFTIDLSKPGVWNELGERSGDGGVTWQPTNRLIAYRVEDR